MNSELILEKKYNNAVVINYIQASQLFLIRCIYSIVKHDSNYVDCIIVSVNDPLNFNEDETSFFEDIKIILKNYNIDFYYFNSGGKVESSQQAYVFGKLKDKEINDIVYLHEDCFIEKDNCIRNLVETTKNNDKIFGGIIYKTFYYYTARNELFYFNSNKLSEYFIIEDSKTWSGQQIGDEKVDAGTGLLSYFFYNKQELMNSFNIGEYIFHPGDILKSYHINSEYYNIANDYFNFSKPLGWFIGKYDKPTFLERLFAKQYSYIVSMVKDGVVMESYDNDWMVSETVKKMPTIPYMLKKKS